MLSTLITSLTSVREFLSRAFLIAAFLPTLFFVSTNALILFLWSWPVHHWIEIQLFGGSTIYKTFLFAVLFIGLWIYSYVVAALTPFLTRTLEGKNWWTWLREPGKKYHSARYQEISNAINKAAEISVGIEQSRPTWHSTILKAKQPKPKTDFAEPPQPKKQNAAKLTTQQFVANLRKTQNADQLIQLAEIELLVESYCEDISTRGVCQELEPLANDITQLSEYAYNRALTEHSRLLNQRNTNFGDQEEIAPTRFGNVGLSAQAYAMRAYRCNIVRIWTALYRAINKEEAAAKALENCKSQLDFFVASFWLSLIASVLWSAIFTWHGEWHGAILSATVGPLLCGILWYGAAVEQYRVLQDLIITSLNGSRFQVIGDLRFSLPKDLFEERDLWRVIDFSIGNGEQKNLHYQYPKS